MLEAELQRQVAEYLDLRGLVWCHVANERCTTPQRGAFLKAQGVKAGVPDVLIFTAPRKRDYCRGVALELKAKGGRLSEHQKQWGEALELCGWHWRVCRSIDDVVDTLERLGL